MTNSYTTLLQQYIAHSNEKGKVIEALISCLDGKIYKNILDIGCGTGAITDELVKYAEKVVAIDTHERIGKKVTDHPKVNFAQQSFQDFKTIDRFDIIVMSFLLWEIPYKEWDSIFEKAFKLLKQNGVIIVIDAYTKTIYNNPFFFFNTPDTAKNSYPDWYEYLQKNGWKYTDKKFLAQIQAESDIHMYQILKFFFQNKPAHTWYKVNKNKILADFQKKQKGNKTTIQLEYFINCITKTIEKVSD